MHILLPGKYCKKRIEAILLMPKPKNSSDIKIWLGTLQMLKKFDSGFAEAASGLNKVSNKYSWGPEQEESWMKIRSILENCEFKVTRIDLGIGKELVLETDASKVALAGVLYYEDLKDPDMMDLLNCYSRTLKSEETRYACIRRECLGILCSCRKNRKIIGSRRFAIRTDHLPLIGLFKKDLKDIRCPYLREYVKEMREDYIFDLEYWPGELNGADGMSRFPMDQLYEFVEFKQDGESYLVLTKKGSWKKFIKPGKRSAVLWTAHSRKHLGYTEMCRE